MLDARNTPPLLATIARGVRCGDGVRRAISPGRNARRRRSIVSGIIKFVIYDNPHGGKGKRNMDMISCRRESCLAARAPENEIQELATGIPLVCVCAPAVWLMTSIESGRNARKNRSNRQFYSPHKPQPQQQHQQQQHRSLTGWAGRFGWSAGRWPAGRRLHVGDKSRRKHVASGGR